MILEIQALHTVIKGIKVHSEKNVLTAFELPEFFLASTNHTNGGHVWDNLRTITFEIGNLRINTSNKV